MTMNRGKAFKPIWFMVIGISILVIPTLVYLCFLIPTMEEEYQILLASGGTIGGVGMFGTEMIPEEVKYGTLFKTASKSFTLLVVVTLIQKFIPQIIGLIACMIGSYILFKLFRELYRNGKRKQQNSELAEEISRTLTKATE